MTTCRGGFEADEGPAAEAAGPPVYCVPPADVRLALLRPSPHRTFCEWKGDASYLALHLDGRTIHNVAWSYHEPLPGYEVIRDHLAFYAGLVDEAWVGEE